MLLLKNFLENICAKHFFGLSYWAPRINSSTVLCQTRDHLLSKTFHGTKHFGKKHPSCPHIFTLLFCCWTRSYSHPSGMECHLKPWKVRDTRHRTNSEYQMSDEECYKRIWILSRHFLGIAPFSALFHPSSHVIVERWSGGFRLFELKVYKQEGGRKNVPFSRLSKLSGKVSSHLEFFQVNLTFSRLSGIFPVLLETFHPGCLESFQVVWRLFRF